MSCLFCQTVRKEAPAEIIYEDEKIIVFNNIKPKAPTHLLITTKEHIVSVAHLADKDRDLAGQLILTGQRIAREREINGYKLIFNVGKDGGQMIEHLHLHLLAGWRTPEERDLPGMP